MAKKLSEMTLEELWALFPIVLMPHDGTWKEAFQAEKERLVRLFGSVAIVISHIGSTAIPDIYAKPIVDILVEFSNGVSLKKAAELLAANGYLIMSETETRVSLNKGYTENGFAERVYHLHLRFKGDNDELYFRDYLLENPLVAKEYETLKLSLWKPYEHDRDGYTVAKSDFVKKYTELAKNTYKNRYK